MQQTMVANPKLSPMSAYKIRKILLTQTDQNQLFDESSDSLEAAVDIDKLLITLYSEDELVLKIRELEALAACYQTLLSTVSQNSLEVQELKKQILSILRPQQSESLDLKSRGGSTPNPLALFEAQWLSGSRCKTVADSLEILNHLLQISAKYVGPQIAQRTLMIAQPVDDWLAQFSVAGKTITFAGSSSEALSTTKLKSLQTWVAAYIDFCSSIISNFRVLLAQNFDK